MSGGFGPSQFNRGPLLGPIPGPLRFRLLVRKLLRPRRIDDERMVERLLVPHATYQVAGPDNEGRPDRSRPIVQRLDEPRD